MDKKLPQNLDPKLKEVYNRVMGFTPAQAPPPSYPAPQRPTVPQTTVVTSNPPPALPISQTPTFVANTDSKTNQSVSPKILVVLAVIFFVVYMIFWVKFFNVNLPIPIPFLNP